MCERSEVCLTFFRFIPIYAGQARRDTETKSIDIMERRNREFIFSRFLLCTENTAIFTLDNLYRVKLLKKILVF